MCAVGNRMRTGRTRRWWIGAGVLLLVAMLAAAVPTIAVGAQDGPKEPADPAETPPSIVLAPLGDFEVLALGSRLPGPDAPDERNLDDPSQTPVSFGPPGCGSWGGSIDITITNNSSTERTFGVSIGSRHHRSFLLAVGETKLIPATGIPSGTHRSHVYEFINNYGRPFHTEHDLTFACGEAGGSISGTITDWLGVPLDGTTACVFQDGSDWNQCENSSADGQYVIPDIEPGLYHVSFANGQDRLECWRDAAGCVNRTLLQVDLGQNRTGVDASLAPVTAFCNSRQVTVDIRYGDLPTERPDVIRGTNAADTIDGLGGADIVCALGGDDTVYAGAGNDLVYGGDGDDALWGGPGNDQLYGGNGMDLLLGADGVDRLFGQEGEDELRGGIDNDYLYGGNDGDELHGNAGVDRLFGQAGNDELFGGGGGDFLYGAVGRDDLWGGTGNDFLYGHSDRDFLYGEDGNDILWGLSGADTMFGDDGDDVLFGATGEDILFGGDGDDDIYGQGHDDRIVGGDGDDLGNGGAGDDTCEQTESRVSCSDRDVDLCFTESVDSQLASDTYTAALRASNNSVSIAHMLAGCNNVPADGIYTGGPAIFAGIHDMISEAQQEVIIQMFEFELGSNGATLMGQGIADALSALPPGDTLSVRVITRSSFSAADLLSQAGWSSIDMTRVDFRLVIHSAFINGAMHDKVVIVDGKSTVVGGANPQFKQDGPGAWYDLAVRVDGPIVLAALENFEFAWEQENFAERCGLSAPACFSESIDSAEQPWSAFSAQPSGDLVSVALSRVNDHGVPGLADTNNPQDRAWMAALDNAVAGSTISVMSPNINDNNFVNRVIDATDRGVTVQILSALGFNEFLSGLPTQGGSNCSIAEKIINDADPTHIDIRWHSLDGVTPISGNGDNASHAKFMGIDDASGTGIFSIIGSGNQDTQSWDSSDEFNLLLDGPAITDRLMAEAFNPVWATGVAATTNDCSL